MHRTVYLNGEFLPETKAKVSIFDRGFLFADGVYEVTAVLKGRLIDNAAHLARLKRSLEELRIPVVLSDQEIISAQKILITRNNIDEGLVYLQITRGPAERNFAYPDHPKPTLVMFTQTMELINPPAARSGISVISLPDIRWLRRDIKSVGLLPASMAKQFALDAGADDAWMVEDDLVTEGTSNNAFIFTQQGVIKTRRLSNHILHGTTRSRVLRLAAEAAIEVDESPFSLKQAQEAKEAFITSATTFLLPVVNINGYPVGDGKPGPMVNKLRKAYIEAVLADAGHE